MRLIKKIFIICLVTLLGLSIMACSAIQENAKSALRDAISEEFSSEFVEASDSSPSPTVTNAPSMTYSSWEEAAQNIFSEDFEYYIDDESKLIKLNFPNISEIEHFMYEAQAYSLYLGMYGNGEDSLPSFEGSIAMYFPGGCILAMYTGGVDITSKIPYGVATTLSIIDDTNNGSFSADEIQESYTLVFDTSMKMDMMNAV